MDGNGIERLSPLSFSDDGKSAAIAVGVFHIGRSRETEGDDHD
jgi:hypothetical protein